MSKDYLEESVIDAAVKLRIKAAYWEQDDEDCEGACNCDGDYDFTITYPIESVCHGWNHYAYQGQDDDGKDIFDIHPNSAAEAKFDGEKLSFLQWTTLSCQKGPHPEGYYKELFYYCHQRDNPCDICGRIIDIEMPNILKHGWYENMMVASGMRPRIAKDNNGYCVVSMSDANGDVFSSGVGKVGCDRVDFGAISQYGSGFDSAIAVNDHGDCVVFFRKTNDITELHYNIGVVDYEEQRISFSGDSPIGFDIQTPIVVLDNDGNIVICGPSYERGKFYYCVGKLDRERRSIEWGELYTYEAENGAHPCVALDNNGACCLVYAAPLSSDYGIYLQAGTINPSGKSIDFDSEPLQIQEESSIQSLTFAINDNGYGVLAVSNSDLDQMREAVLKAECTEDGIDWSACETVLTGEYENGAEASISIDNSGDCVRLFRGRSSDDVLSSVTRDA